jgi:GH35 family endo-1,4-beta-xylanase
MNKTTLDRRVLLTSEQKAKVAELRTWGFTRSQAWLRVLTPEQRQVFYDQIRTAARLRYKENPYREIIREHEGSETALAGAAPNTTLGNSQSRSTTLTGRRTVPCCGG